MKKTLSLLATPALITIILLSLITSCIDHQSTTDKKNTPVAPSTEGVSVNEIKFTSQVQDAINQDRLMFSSTSNVKDIVNMDSSSRHGDNPIHDYFGIITKQNGSMKALYPTEEELSEGIKSNPKAVFENSAKHDHLFVDYEDFKSVFGMTRGLAVYIDGKDKVGLWCIETSGYTAKEILDADILYFVPKRIWMPRDEGRPFYIKSDDTIIECELKKMGNSSLTDLSQGNRGDAQNL